MLYKSISINIIIFFFIIIISYHKVISYINFKLEFLPKNNYKLFINQTLLPEQIIQQIYYNNIITKLEIGTPPKIINALIKLNNDIFYISSTNPSLISEEKAKDSDFYKFTTNDDLFNELLSSSYIEVKCKHSIHGVYYYSEICSSKEKIQLNIDNKITTKEFPIRLVKNNDENIPGSIGLLYNVSYYGQERSLVTELKSENIIDNYYFFFHFDKISPLNKNINGQLIIGGLPHDIFPYKYSIENYKSTTSYVVPYIFKSWRLNFDKIFIEEENKYFFEKTITALSYEIYNIISTIEFHYKIKEKFLNKLLEEKKCFYSNFSQNIYTDNNMTFYYCYTSVKNILYENLPFIRFVSISLDYTFEITKDELFYIKNDFIYFNILFCEKEFNFWLLGQMFTTKYNFVFNTDSKQIGIYKNVKQEPKKDININNNNINKNNNNFLIIFIIILCFCFTCLGLIIGKKIFGLKRKIIVNELIEEQNYEYKSNNNKNMNLNIEESYYKPIGRNNKNTVIEMKKKFSE